MLMYIFRRLLQSIPTFLGITLLSYSLIVAAPGDPVSIMTFGPRATKAQKVAMSEQLGVKDPVYKQYIRWLIAMTGRKFRKLDGRGNPVRDDDGNVIMERVLKRHPARRFWHVVRLEKTRA